MAEPYELDTPYWATGPINIALVKYWGKHDEEGTRPCNSSLSITLSTAHLSSTTRVIVRMGGGDEFRLDGLWHVIGPRMQRVLDYYRDFWPADWEICFRVESANSMPTAAGLASSASGFAALSAALARACGATNVLTIQHGARLGSGSACRSIDGGFVLWDVDSGVRRLFPTNHWPGLRLIVVVASTARKEVGSSEAMERTVRTSSLFQHRLKGMAAKIGAATEAIGRRDFERLAELVMRESNEFHAVCLDTYPPLLYLSDRSREVMAAVHVLNRESGRNVAAYTFDAGPNAVVLTLAEHLVAVQARLDGAVGPARTVVCTVGRGALAA